MNPSCRRTWACLASLLGLLLASSTQGATVLHVAAQGSDEATGSAAAPLRTLNAALQKGRGAASPVVLKVRGRLELDAPLQLVAADSGVTIEGEENAPAVISGGRRITGWQRDPARAGVWTVTLPEVQAGRWYFHQLFAGEQRLQRARTPNEGFFQLAAPLGTNTPITVPFRGTDLRPEWARYPDGRLILLIKWTDLQVPIRSVDVERREATVPGGPRPYWMDERDARYWVENVPDALDAAGEWYLDRATGVLSLRPPGEADPNTLSIVAPVLKTLVRVAGTVADVAENIVFRRVTFAETDYDMPADGMISPQAAVPVRGAVQVQFARRGRFEDCRFLNLGGYGLDLARGAQEWRLVRSEIRGSGAGGVRIGEPDDRQPDATAACGGHVIEDNHLHQLGRVFAPAVGVILFQTGRNRIAHNEINDLYYTAVSVGWNWGYQETPCRENVIEFNHLHHIGQGRLTDMGAVYTLGIQPGTVVRNNLIHDVTSHDYGGWGLYTDEGSTGIVLENNVVYRCKSAGFHQHYGRENVVRNNILAFNRDHQLMRTRDEDHVSFTFTNNIVYFDSGTLLGSSWKNDRFVIDRNLYFDTRAAADPASIRFAGVSWVEWKARGHDVNSLLADPQFENPAALDFRLQASSPALARGFKPIDLSQVGPRHRR